MFLQYLRRVLNYDRLLLVSEPNAAKRELCLKFGADRVIDPGDRDAVEAVQDHTSGKGVDYLIEASGAGRVLAFIPGLIRKQATVILYGHGHAGVDLSVLNNLMFREPTLITPVGASGGFEPDGRPSAYLRALNLIEQRRIEVAPLISHRYTALESVQCSRSLAGCSKLPLPKGEGELFQQLSRLCQFRIADCQFMDILALLATFCDRTLVG